MLDFAIIILAIILSGFVGYKIGCIIEKKRQNERVKFAEAKYKSLQQEIREYILINNKGK